MTKYRNIICYLVGVVVLFLIANTVYGYCNKETLVIDALGFKLPINSQFYSYRYFMGNFQAVIICDGEEGYDYCKYNILCQDVSYSVNDVDLSTANTIKLTPLEDKCVSDAVEFFAENPPRNISGVLFKLEGETLIYLVRPIPMGFDVISSLT